MKLKLLEALRNNDISKLADLVKQIDNNSINYDLVRLKDELLLFAVQVGSLSIIKHLIEHNYVEDINSQDSDGNTALHLAAASNRNDVIEYLMALPNINDCLYNKEAKQPIQCATNIETAQLMDYLRSQYIEKIAAKLRSGFESRNFELLDKLLTNPRDKELLDINGTDPITSDTVLIEFVKKNDYEMVKFILTHGGDPFKRSLSGKLPEECTTNPIMKQIISDSFNNQNIMEVTARPQDGSPTFKGFLKKWTNFAGGYKLRWVVLDSTATLSYYKSPNDMNNTCRGSIHLAHAMLRVDSSENTKFEIIIQNPSDGSPVRWHLMANHATEAQKWIWVLQNAIRFAKDTEKKQRTSMMLTHRAKDQHQSTSSPSTPIGSNHPLENELIHTSHHSHVVPYDHSSVPVTIPETEVLTSTVIQKEHDLRKPVATLISDAHQAAEDMKKLIETHDSETELPLKAHHDEPQIEEAANVDNDVHEAKLDNDNDNDNANDDDNDNNIENLDQNETTIALSPNELNTNNTISDNSDSLRNQYGPVPDRSSEYSGASKQNATVLDPNYHNRSSSVTSFNSNNSEQASKSSRATRLYKKPLHKLSKIGRKTRDSFLVDNESKRSNISNNSTGQLARVDSNTSYISNSSSAVSSPNMNTTNDFENDNYDEEENEYNSGFSQNRYNSSSSSNGVTQSTDLNVVRNQMAMQLKTFKDFLSSAAVDENISKNELVDHSVGILSTLNMLINQEGECVNVKYNELVRRLEKQQKISSIWENSIKQLEMEIHDRESKIVELEDKLKALKKSLRTSISQLHSNHAGKRDEGLNHLRMLPKEMEKPVNENSAASLARQRLTANLPRKNVEVPSEPVVFTPHEIPAVEHEQENEEDRALQQQRALQEKFNIRTDASAAASTTNSILPPTFAPPPVPIDSTLTEFLEESDDSDDEFFDAEDTDNIKDMSVLTRRETLRAQKRKSIIQGEQELKQFLKEEQREQQQQQQQQPATATPPVPAELPPPVPTIHQELEPESAFSTGNRETGNRESFERGDDTADKGEFLPLHSVNVERHEDVSTEELPKPHFQPSIDQHGHYVVNKHELTNESQTDRYGKIISDQSFEGYEDPLRLSLAPEDTRPKLSLWSVLKSLVGKDMTKMTLPVSFNEPTSLLQRNVEVIEYSDLLDKASAIDSSTLRLVYVATFAASEYASTVGRIAKPFNPLLGETFEYSRPDKGYRCFVEQVSHHPPISALVAESPSWSYYGESNVKTKFLGRSFDIKHLGTWFCEVYPDAGVECKDGSKSDKEVYSWKKVNNSVIGIIVGNPTIDNYGEMEIHNHMTGDYMKFEFKPRGWRASSAYEVKGEVFNAQGKLMYYVGGHWNSKIFCKPADDKQAERFLIWEAAPRQEMMFHLTNFAATLNAPQPHLLPKIACTDTRLRPDQRAMENGDYDLAAAEKNKVEEKQREARRQRELKGEVYKPSFFTRARHPVTREEYWKYEGTYWRDRIEGKLKNYKDIF